MPQRPIFAIFEGGGAKGVAHVGAVAACERNDFYFVGVAGASAGALAAALVAVGYSADELLDPTRSRSNILARHGLTPIQLLGQTDWNALKAQRERIGAYLDDIGAARQGWKAHPTVDGLRKVFKALPLLGPLKDYLAERWPYKGLMSNESVKTFLNTVLREKVIDHRNALGLHGPVHARVTFSDIDPVRFGGRVIPLKIIGTNVSTRELWIFDKDVTPDVAVADAVAASIAIPGVFQPVSIGVKGVSHRFVDGGVVSNLPIWVFNNEKLAFERANTDLGPAPIVGFTLKDKPKASPQIGSTTAVSLPSSSRPPADPILGYLGAVVQTALSGSQTVSQRFVQDLTVAPLHTSLTLLQFDASEAELLNGYNDGLRCAEMELKHALIERPRLVKDRLDRIHQIARKQMVALIPPSERRKRWKLRVSIVEPSGHGTFHVTFGHNMDADADDRLALDERGRGAPAAFLSKSAELVAVGSAWSPSQVDYMTKYERRLVPRSIRSKICIPIFPDLAAWQVPAKRKPQPCGVLILDSTRSLQIAFNDPNFMALILYQSTLLHRILTQEPKRG